MADFLGRQISYGVGVESARGTAIASDYWVRHLSADFQDRTDKVLNESASGVVDKYNESDIARRWGEGSIEAKVQDQSVGVLLYGAFGSVSTSANGDASGNVYDHTFSIAQNVTPQSITVVKKTPNVDRAFALGQVDSFELTAEQGNFAKVNVGIIAKPSAAASSTVAYIDESEFTSKHITVKSATDVAGLSGASAIEASEVTLSIAKAVEPYYAYGDTAPTEIHSTAVEVSGSFVLKHSSSTYTDIWENNSAQALEIELLNGDVTIGTAANPTITLTIPKYTIESVDEDQSLDGIVMQTVNFRALYDTTTAKTIDCVLTNLAVSY